MNKLGIINSKREDINGYIFKQMVEYNENDFREHVKKHEYSTSLIHEVDDDKTNSGIFTSDFPLDKVIEEIKNNLYPENRLCYGFYTDMYTFKYNECGIIDGNITDYIRVVCFNNTKNIITLCPSPKYESCPFIDLNYLVDKKEDNKVKTKRLSQIDKFNRKYNIN